jgi:hypothetical protein
VAKLLNQYFHLLWSIFDYLRGTDDVILFGVLQEIIQKSGDGQTRLSCFDSKPLSRGDEWVGSGI